MATLGQILESMMKVVRVLSPLPRGDKNTRLRRYTGGVQSNDRRTRRRKEIESGYQDGFAKVEGKAREWIDGLRAREYEIPPSYSHPFCYKTLPSVLSARPC